MIQKKTLAALEKVISALAPLDPESRRQVIEDAAHFHDRMRIALERNGGGTAM